MTTGDDKLSTLKELLLDQAEAQRHRILQEAREELQGWLREQEDRLAKEEEMILDDARRRAEEVRLRQVINAEREDSLETLRYQNRLISEALAMLREELVKLRERDDYPMILAGLAMEGIESAGMEGAYLIRLSANDSSLGDQVAWLVKTNMPDARVSFDPEPAPILGGLWLASQDGRREVRLDWQARAQELSEKLAERLLQLL